MIDTSASLRRGGMWTKALEQAKAVLADCRPGDQLAVFSFDAQTYPLLTFNESMTLDPARRDSVARAHVEHLAPSWGGTNLGQALIDVVSAIEDVADSSEKSGRMPRRVVLISDLAQGSHLEALGDFEWPKDVELELKTITDTGSNAGLLTLADSVEPGLAEPGTERRVRVFNDASSRQESFELVWVDESGKETADAPVAVYVPPGESRVVRVPRPKGTALHCCLRLRGDACNFDNTIYFADETREEKSVIYIGSDRADDSSGLRYYLERVFVDTPQRRVHIDASEPTKALKIERPTSVPLVIVTAETSDENARILKEYVRSGWDRALRAYSTRPCRDALQDFWSCALGPGGIECAVMSC